MAKYTNDELLEAFGEMTLVELSEFVKAFEEKFDVEAAAPAAVAVAAPGAAAPAEDFDPAAWRAGDTSPEAEATSTLPSRSSVTPACTSLWKPCLLPTT